METPCVQRLHRSSYAGEVRVTSQVEVQKKPDKQHNQTKQDRQTTPTQKRLQQKTALKQPRRPNNEKVKQGQ